MSGRFRTLSALLVLAFAVPASAQTYEEHDHRKPKDPDVEVHDHRKGKPDDKAKDDDKRHYERHIAVASWLPQTGPAGTKVTLNGSGFTADTQVLVGGKKVRATIAETVITFDVPAAAGSGEIRLRKPSQADDVVVGSFALLIDPSITSFAPLKAARGSRIEVRGKGFEKGDQLLVNGKPVALAEATADRLVFVVPDWAATDWFYVARASGAKARSNRQLYVLAAPPTLASFAPESGIPGTTVRISGLNYQPTDKVLYGTLLCEVKGRGAGWVDVAVPKSTHDGRFAVVGEGGRATAATDFQLVLPPVIRSYQPRWGAAGTQITISGHNFRANDLVSMGGKRLDIIQLQEGQIVATVTPACTSGKLVISRGSYTAESGEAFEVVNPPAITGFEPTTGEAGATVTVTGSWFLGAEVWYGATKLRPSKLEDKSLTVTIPKNATDQKFRVKSRGGEATSATEFRVQIYGVVGDVHPRRGQPGADLTVPGRNLDHVDHYYLGGVELPVKSRTAGSVILTLPAGVATGPIAWTSNGRRQETSWQFIVVTPPVIAGFSPEYGAPGSQVIVRGDRFDKNTRVFYGKAPLKIVKVDAPNQLTVEIPIRAGGGKDYFWVDGDGVRSKAATTFEVKAVPVVVGVNPWAGKAGDQIEIKGTNFEPGTEILIDQWRANVVKRSADRITVEVPAAATVGSYWLVARTGTLEGRSSKKFDVQAVAPTVEIHDHRKPPPEQPKIEIHDHRKSK